MNFYTSDLHLGHANVIKFDNRPFARENEKCSTEDAFTNVFSSYVIDAGESFLKA